MFRVMDTYSPTAQDDAILGALMRPDRTLETVAIDLKLAPSHLLLWASRPEIRALLASLSELLAITEGIRRAARATTSFIALERVMKESSNLEQVRRAATTTLNAKVYSPSLREGAGRRGRTPDLDVLLNADVAGARPQSNPPARVLAEDPFDPVAAFLALNGLPLPRRAVDSHRAADATSPQEPAPATPREPSPQRAEAILPSHAHSLNAPAAIPAPVSPNHSAAALATLAGTARPRDHP